MTRTRFVPLSILAGLALVGLAGCGGVDTGSVEKEIKKNAKAQANLDVSVKCPEDVDDKEGEKFNCTVTYPDKTTDEVEVTLVADDKFDFDFVAKGGEEEAGKEEDAGDEDEATIRALFAEVDKDPTQLCTPEFATEALVEALGGDEECVAAAEKEAATDGGPTEVKSVEIEDGTATAEIEDEEGPSTVTLVRDPEQEGGWLVEAVE